MNQTLVPVSVIVLSHINNELLHKALASVQWASELIVIDDGAKLDASEFDKKYGAKIITRKSRISDFSQARNEALKFATLDWVFFLDSDEAVTPDSVSHISQAILSNAAGIQIKRTDIFHGQKVTHGEVGDVWLTRLARTKSITFERPVHEIAIVQGNVIKSQIEVLHYAHASVSEFFYSVWEYAKMEAAYRHSHSQKCSLTRLLFNPAGKFLFNFIWKSGWRDGMAGVTYAVLMSFHSLLVRVFLYEYALKK